MAADSGIPPSCFSHAVGPERLHSALAFMNVGYKLLALQVLVAAYVLLFLRQFVSAPFIYGRLMVFFLAGAVLALFVQGPRYGTIDPISTRPVVITMGVLLMGAGLVWGFAIRGHI